VWGAFYRPPKAI
jgi:hypothetical protein